MSIRDILRQKGTNVVTVTPASSVANAAHRLRIDRIGALVVSENGRDIAGILSERDIVQGLSVHGPRVADLPVSALMSHHVVTCPPDAGITDAMRLMTQHRIRHLPVVSDGRLEGIVSIGDVVKSRLQDMELETSVLRDYAVAHH
jgi:CBS domain-containing protein